MLAVEEESPSALGSGEGEQIEAKNPAASEQVPRI